MLAYALKELPVSDQLNEPVRQETLGRQTGTEHRLGTHPVSWPSPMAVAAAGSAPATATGPLP